MTHEEMRPDGTFRRSYDSTLTNELMDRWANRLYKNEWALKASWARSLVQSLCLYGISFMTSGDTYKKNDIVRASISTLSQNGKPEQASSLCYCVISYRKQTRAVYCTTSSFKTFRRLLSPFYFQYGFYLHGFYCNWLLFSALLSLASISCCDFSISF